MQYTRRSIFTICALFEVFNFDSKSVVGSMRIVYCFDFFTNVVEYHILLLCEYSSGKMKRSFWSVWPNYWSVSAWQRQFVSKNVWQTNRCEIHNRSRIWIRTEISSELNRQWGLNCEKSIVGVDSLNEQRERERERGNDCITFNFHPIYCHIYIAYGIRYMTIRTMHILVWMFFRLLGLLPTPSFSQYPVTQQPVCKTKNGNGRPKKN